MATATDELVQSTKQALASLNAQREALESEASAVTSELTAPLESGGAPMGVDTPLVDSDGYPRGDIDVYRARSLRSRLAIIRTDHKRIMGEIETKLEQLMVLQNPQRAEQDKAEIEQRKKPKPKPKYDAATGKWVVTNWDGTTISGAAGSDRTPSIAQAAVGQSPAASGSGVNALVPPSLPFAKVNAVAPHSPAEAAGLLEDDLIVRFGNITIDSPNGFHALAEAVPVAAGDQQSIEILVKRGSTQEMKTVNLLPGPWEGRGLIGCHIVPFQN